MAEHTAASGLSRGSPVKHIRLQDDIRAPSTKHAGEGRSSTVPLQNGNRQNQRDNGRRQVGRGGRRSNVTRRPKSACSDPEVRKGIGAVLLALSVLMAIVGVVMTVVAATDDNQNGKYPPAFSAVGPVLLVLAVTMAVAGFSLVSPIMCDLVERCFSFDDPHSFCRVHFPRLSHFIKPDSTIFINQAAMKALKTEPGKSVLKRQPPPPTNPYDTSGSFTALPSSDTSSNEGTSSNRVLVATKSLDSGDAKVSVVSETNGRRISSKGVRFSESDADDYSKRPRGISVSSDSSLVSLRHCKIHPKESTDGENKFVWHTEKAVPVEAIWGTKEIMTTEL